MIDYKIYIELGNHNCVHKMLSTAFYTEEELEKREAIYIDTVSLEDNDDTVNGQCLQNTYFVDKYGEPVLDGEGKSNFKYEISKIVKLSKEEKEQFFPPVKTQPSELEKLKLEQEVTAQAVQDLILMMMEGE